MVVNGSSPDRSNGTFGTFGPETDVYGMASPGKGPAIHTVGGRGTTMSDSELEDALARVAHDLSEATEAIRGEAMRSGNHPPPKGRRGRDELARPRGPERPPRVSD